MRLGMPLTVVMFLVVGAGCPAGDDGDSGAGTDASSGGTAMTDPATTDPAMTDPVTTDPATTDSSSMSATTDPVTTDPATTDPATTDPTTTDPATTDPSDTTEDPGTETDPTETTGSQGDPCEVTKEDSECDTCVKTMCCDQLTACNEDPECVCFQECAGSMEPSLDVPQVCGDMCGVAQPFAHPTIGQVLSCSNGCILQCL